MSYSNRHFHRIPILSALLLLALVLLSACGGSATSSNTSSGGVGVPTARQFSAQDAAKAKSNSSGQGTSGTSSNPGYDNINVYLIKSLVVDMAVPDTQKTANNLQTWLKDTDPQSSSAGISYDQTSDNHFSISLKYSVEASQYDQIRNYLASYPPQQHGKLIDLHENVQDVTNDYVDTQSRITNLQIEQKRLQTILSNATTIGDVISVESRLADVEGQLEQITSHMKALQGQTTFYDVTINLQPLATTTSLAPDNTNAWNPGQAFHDAWSASLAFGVVLLTILFWVLSFSPYLLIVAAIIVWWYWWRKRQIPFVRPAVAAPVTTPSTPPGNTPE